jgi:uncharacterized membrane protein YkvA (DUF1232 family)
VVRTLLYAGIALLSCWLVIVVALVVLGRGIATRELAMLLPNLVRLFGGLGSDARVPRRSKALLIIGAAWLVSPIDLIPEFIPFLGPLDDAVVAALILRHVLRTAGPEAVAEHWRGDPATLDRILRLAGASR